MPNFVFKHSRLSKVTGPEVPKVKYSWNTTVLAYSVLACQLVVTFSLKFIKSLEIELNAAVEK